MLGASGWSKIGGDRGVLRRDSATAVSVANGQQCEVIGSLVLPIQLGQTLKLVNAIVVPGIKSDIILGVDFWKAFKIRLGATGREWRIGQMADLASASTETSVVSRHELRESQKRHLDELLQRFSSVEVPKIGLAKGVEHVIDTGSHRPVKQRYVRRSPAMLEIMNRELDEMLANGIVRPSLSPWSSPVVISKKKDGSHRFCVDYRLLNSITVKDSYPLPLVEQILDQLRNAKFLSSLDIKSAFWQIKISESSIAKTAFTVPGRGLFEFLRMPFGLVNSPATWQRLADSLIGPELEGQAFVYLDDIVIATADFETHLRILERVLSKLSEAGLTLNWEKSQFCRTSLSYLGYVVDHNGLHVDPAKVEAIVDFPRPKTVKQLRRFLGVASWYRRFV
ncbi:unnamed protein product [Nesidiocoris tenuis]|uniref:Reverse transcriptase domain-containing protein n=1 Tax=Nesidiocoris tenuis TaxID=355587 RepID=A0A6H5G6H4_9HEMI|nr:unnamed protein product [Nesidiocoris tenuis]